MPINQGLLKKNPSLTTEDFSESWYNRHAALVVPWFLASGVTYYAQVHGPLSTDDKSLDVSEWSGAAEMKSGDVEELFSATELGPQWKKDYYVDVILKDEKRLLASLATEHIFQAGPDTVNGDRRVVIEHGKSLIEIPEDIMKIWEEYEARGN